MKFGAIGQLLLAETMAVQTRAIGHLSCLLDFFLMTRILTACLVGNKLSVVNRHQSTFDDSIWYLMAVLATGLYQPFVTFAILKEMTRKTYIIVYIEVFVAFEVAMAGATRDSDAVNHSCNVTFVSELNTFVVDIT